MSQENSWELMRPNAGAMPTQSAASVPRYEDPEEESSGPNLQRLVAAVLRYKWPILALTIVGTAVGIAISRYLPQRYQAQATIWIEAGSNSRNDDQGPIQQANLLDQSDAWVDLLRSYAVLDDVVRERHLYLDVENPAEQGLFEGFELADRFVPGKYRLEVDGRGKGYTLALESGVRLEQGSVGDSIGLKAGLLWKPDARALAKARRVDFELKVPREVSLDLARDLRTAIDKRGTFLQVSLTREDPESAAGVLNAILDRYVDIAAELKRGKLDELTKILAEQLTTAESRLTSAEMKLQDFRVHTITLPTQQSPVAGGLQQTEDPVFDHYFEMKLGAEQLRRDREAIESALSGSSGTVDALEVIGSVQQSSALKSALSELTQRESELRALRYRYTDSLPAVQHVEEQVKTLREQTIPNLARALESDLATRESQVNSQIGSASAELKQIPPRMIEEAGLTRQVAIAENLYRTLQQRHEEARLAAASSIPDVRVLDKAAIPQKPVNDQKPMVILMAFAGSLGLGILGALLRDRTDPTVRYPEQVTAGMGLPILGGIPEARRHKGEPDEDDVAQLVEAFRALRLNVLHAHGFAGPVCLTITSPGSGDGKSFISSNLGIAFGELGHRTLVIDGDVRRGGLHRIFGGRRTPGLTDFLGGTASLEQVIQHTSYSSVDFIGFGSRLNNAPELLGSVAMREVLVELRSRYRTIIVDTSPMGASSDAFVLGTLTGNLMLVLRTGATDRPLAESKLELLERLPIRVLGAALNSVPQSGVYRYYSYLPGYEARDESDPRALAAGGSPSGR